MSHRRTSFTAASVSITALLLTGCAPAEDDEQSGTVESPQPTQTETETETAEPSPTPEATPTDEEDEGAEEGSVGGRSGDEDSGGEDAEGQHPDDGDPDDFSEGFNPEEFDSSAVEEIAEDAVSVGELIEVRLGHHDGFERLVFEFTGDDGPTAYRVEWVDEVVSMRTGRELEVAGEAILYVQLDGLEPDPDSDNVNPLVVEPLIFEPGHPVLEAHYDGVYQELFHFYIGVDAERDFSVEERDEPGRLVIDVAH